MVLPAEIFIEEKKDRYGKEGQEENEEKRIEWDG